MRILVWFALMFFLVPCAISLHISEVYPNPDSGEEWVEIYVDEPINLSLLGLGDKVSSKRVICCSGNCTNMSMPGFLTIGPSREMCTDSTRIGNGLSNSGDAIFLYFDGELIDQMEYFSTKKGISYSYVDDKWCESLPSPGRGGTCKKDYPVSLKIILSEYLYTDIEYTNLFKITNELYPEQCTNVTINYSISRNGTLVSSDLFCADVNKYTSSNTGDVKFDEPGKYLLCGTLYNTVCKNLTVRDPSKIPCNISLTVDIDDFINNDSEKIGLSLKLSDDTFPFVISYWIEDLFGNYIKSPRNTTTISEKSFTPYIDEKDSILIFKADLVSIACNNSGNWQDSKIFGVKKEENMATSEVIDTDSHISIEKISLSGNTYFFGDDLLVKVKVYKGDTQKYAVKAWLESEGKRKSKITQFNVYNKGNEYDLMIPIYTEPDCSIGSGNYAVVVEGLGDKKSQEIDVAPSEECTQEVSQDEKVPFIVEYVPIVSSAGDVFNITISIKNSGEEDTSFSSWAYLYRGSRCYSGDREGNILNTIVHPGETKTVHLPISVDPDAVGEMKLKVNVKKGGRKTPDEEIFRHFVQTSRDENPESIKENEKFPRDVLAELYIRARKNTGSMKIYEKGNLPENVTMVLAGPNLIDISEPLQISKGLQVVSALFIENDDIIGGHMLKICANESDVWTVSSIDECNVSLKVLQEKSMERSQITGSVIHSSSSDKASSLIPVLLVCSALAGCLALINLIRK